MRILFFNNYQVGVIRDSKTLVDVSEALSELRHLRPHEKINEIIEHFDSYREPFGRLVRTGSGMNITDVELRPPLPRPVNVVCMALNYMENGTLKEPPAINAFLKSPASIIGPDQTMVFPDIPAISFEGESEIAVVIGKVTSNVSSGAAMDHVFGYTNFIDGSARGLQSSGNTFYQMKSRDTFAAIGPYLVTSEEVKNPQSVQVRQWVNGRLTQDYNTDDMAHGIAKSIAWVSAIHTLYPGDIVAMGTNHRGLSSFQDGDRVESEVDDLGRLAIHCRDDLKRTWPRETRIERFVANGETGPAKQLSGKYSKAE